MTEKIMLFCAHSDDQVIGAGGTIAKYAREEKETTVVIFSHGEGTHPWMKKKVIAKTRVNEAKKAGKILGCKDTLFLGIKDSQIGKHAQELQVDDRIQKLIETIQPSKIFTHSKDDPMPDHRAVHNILINLIDRIDYQGDVYTFDIWNPIKIRERNRPKMMVDITKTLKQKRNALRCFKSQHIVIMPLYIPMYFRALWDGLSAPGLFAEGFFKLS